MELLTRWLFIVLETQLWPDFVGTELEPPFQGSNADVWIRCKMFETKPGNRLVSVITSKGFFRRVGEIVAPHRDSNQPIERLPIC
jgi:hypothetical protein